MRAALYILDDYDMKNHMLAGVAHSERFSDDFVDWFAAAGPLGPRLLPKCADAPPLIGSPTP
jgi:hypothetical protein